MSTSTDAIPLRPAALSPPAHHWIQSPAFDLFFFIAAPLVMLPVTMGALWWSNAFALLGFVMAFAHYVSSFTFYLWDENQERHRTRWLAFFGGPVLITVTFCALVLLKVPLIVQVILFFWNTVHVARQSCGILSVYRHRAGVFDPAQKTAANGAILAVSLWLCLWNIETHMEVRAVAGGRVAAPARPAVGGRRRAGPAGPRPRAARLLRRGPAPGRRPRCPSWPCSPPASRSSTPYLWIADSARATFAMLLPHYLQYLGLVWLLHRRKFTEAYGLARRSSCCSAWRATWACWCRRWRDVGLGFFAGEGAADARRLPDGLRGLLPAGGVPALLRRRPVLGLPRPPRPALDRPVI